MKSRQSENVVVIGIHKRYKLMQEAMNRGATQSEKTNLLGEIQAGRASSETILIDKPEILYNGNHSTSAA